MGRARQRQWPPRRPAADRRAEVASAPGRCTRVGATSLRAFGLQIDPMFPLPGAGRAPVPALSRFVRVLLVDKLDLATRWSGSPAPPAWETVLDAGTPLRHEIGRERDHRITYGSTTFLISADGRCVCCAPGSEDGAAWRRQLLDTILFAASFIQGFELLHASAVELESGAVGFLAASGRGKSSLAAALMLRGHPLFCDDVLAIADEDGRLTAHPGPAVMNVPANADIAGLGGRVLAPFPLERELWIEVPGVATSPRPLSALCLLQTSRGRPAVSEVVGATAIDLLRHSISLPHDASRARRRFDLFCKLAAQTPVWCLRTGDGDPSELADLVQMLPLEHARGPIRAAA